MGRPGGDCCRPEKCVPAGHRLLAESGNPLEQPAWPPPPPQSNQPRARSTARPTRLVGSSVRQPTNCIYVALSSDAVAVRYLAFHVICWLLGSTPLSVNQREHLMITD